MIWARRRSQRDAQPATTGPAKALAALTKAVDVAQVAGWAALDGVIDHLLAIDRTGDIALAGQALELLQAKPRLVVRLDERARRVLWWSAAAYSPVIDQVAENLRDGTAGPVALALASTHGDGHIRARAVKLMLAKPDPRWTPFLVLRTADWVKPVRDQARAGLALLLADQPETYLPAVLGMTLLVSARYRGGFAHSQALAALLSAPAALRDRLVASDDAAQRRFVLDVGMSQGWWPQQTLLELAVAEPEVSTRARAAEIVCRRAVWMRQVDLLRRLARHPRPDVRAVALTGLQRLGHDAEVAAHLDDLASLVRAIARDAARHAGLDAVEHYRTAVSTAEPTPGAIAGLAEAGSHRDAPLLRALLAHPVGRVRAHAIRALRRLDAVPVEQTIAMLRDPSPAVVREATAALRPLTRAVPEDVAWGLLADPDRVELRRAGYRLLRVRETRQHLRAALLLATDPDPGLARQTVADVTRLARDTARPGWRRLGQPALDTAPAQVAELADLTDQAAARLGAETTQLLRAWLADGPR